MNNPKPCTRKCNHRKREQKKLSKEEYCKLTGRLIGYYDNSVKTRDLCVNCEE